MTQPPNDRPEHGQWTPPASDQQPQQWGAPSQPQWTPPQHPNQPQPNQPQPGYGGAPSPHTTDYLGGFAPAPAQPARKRRGPLIASLVAVVALAGGGAATYVALSDSSSGGGAANPQAAVQNVVDDLQNADLVGLLDDLAPGERDALSQPLQDDIAKLKDLKVLDGSADPGSISGVTFKASGLTYGSTITVNDHVRIVPITGGTVDMTGDPSKLPFSNELRELAKGKFGASAHKSVNLADHDPVRIATVEVGGRWYPSIGYTAADAAADHKIPTAADAIAPVGSDSAEDAVKAELEALMSQDWKSAIAHVSPSEVGALHDYGGLVLDSAPSGGSKASIDTLDLATTSESDGVTRVTLKHLVVRVGDQQVSVNVSGSCVSVQVQGQTQNLCAEEAVNLFEQLISTRLCFSADYSSPSDCPVGHLTAAQKTALTHLFSSFTKIGIATTQVDGKWYVNPVRTFVDLEGTFLSGMSGDDLLELGKLGQN